MQRNWDTIRKILLAAEALPTSDCSIGSDERHISFGPAQAIDLGR